MKRKLVITLLLTALATTSLAGCGKKETANVPAEGTEVVAEIDTETEAEEVVVAETETEEIVVAETEEDTESESDTEVVAKNDDKDSDKTETKVNGKSDAGKTESSKNESNNNNKNNGSTSTNNNTQTEQPSAPVETPAVETPAETPAPEPEPAPAQNLCPYGPFDQWLDLGNGWWGYYTCFQSPEGTVSALNKEFTDVIMNSDSTWTYDDSSTELLGTYDDAKDVVLTKVHMVPITN